MNIWDEEQAAYASLDVKRDVYRAGEDIHAAVRGTVWPDYALAAWNRDHSTGAARAFWREVHEYLMSTHCCATRKTQVNVIDDDGQGFRLRKPRWFRTAVIGFFGDPVRPGTGGLSLRWRKS